MPTTATQKFPLSSHPVLLFMNPFIASFNKSLSSMTCRTIADLPSHIIVKIYQSCPHFSTVSALSRTSHTFSDLWTTNITSICTTIMARNIECYDEAYVLYLAQEAVAPIDQALKRREDVVRRYRRDALPEISYLQPESFQTRLTIECMQRFQSNANTMYTALERFNIMAVHKDQKRTLPYRSMTATERESFIKAYYRVTALATLAQRPYLRDLFMPLDMLDLGQMWDVMLWLVPS